MVRVVSKETMVQAAGLPKGIKVLRKFKMDNSVPMRPYRFERLVDRLNECASSDHAKLTRCDCCLYVDECIQRFDAICGRVAMARGAKKKLG